MNLYAIPPGITGFLLLCLSLFVLSHNRRSKIHILLSMFCFSMSWWLYGYTNMYLSDSPTIALFWARVGFIGIAFIPILTFHFILAFLEKEKKIFLYLLYLSTIPALIGNWTPLIYKSVNKHIWGYYPTAGPLYFLFVTLFGISFLSGIFLLYNDLSSLRCKQNKGKYQQVKFVFFGFLIGCFGIVDYVVKFGIDIYPFGYIAAFAFASSIAYAILKYRLLDIEVIIRRTLVFAGLFSFAFAVFAFSTFLTQELLSAYLSGRSARILSMIISVSLIVISYDPLRNFLINLTDRFLFQKKYDYRKLLRDASAGISQIKSLRQLLSLVTHFVTMRIRVRNAAILIHDEKNDYFKLAYMRGYEPGGWLKEDHVFSEGDQLIDYLENERVPLDIERVKEYVETGGPKPKKGVDHPKYDYKAIHQRMEELRAACCVPSFLGNNLRNILILGEKKSGDFFSDEDLHVLYTLAQESAIAIENARLYDQAIEKARELEGINEQLNTAQTNLLRALNETEVANKRLRDTHAQLIHEQKMATLGRLASSVGHEVNNPLTILSMNVSRAILKYRQNPDLKVTEVLDIFHKMEQNISRIKAVVNTLTGLLKKSEHGKFEALSLKLILEETLPLVQFQTYLDNLSGTEVTFDIPGNIPLIKGDLERLQEVFLNLFINAYHAMAGKRDRRITVTAHEDPAHPAMVLVEFSDNGQGMGDDVMKKIFSYGFTTKPAGKGSGMGLYMCRYIIELHGGGIKVRSKLGEGTTFVITLPIASDLTSSDSDTAEEK